jgi:hypothetical protein
MNAINIQLSKMNLLTNELEVDYFISGRGRSGIHGDGKSNTINSYGRITAFFMSFFYKMEAIKVFEKNKTTSRIQFVKINDIEAFIKNLGALSDQFIVAYCSKVAKAKKEEAVLWRENVDRPTREATEKLEENGGYHYVKKGNSTDYIVTMYQYFREILLSKPAPSFVFYHDLTEKSVHICVQDQSTGIEDRKRNLIDFSLPIDSDNNTCSTFLALFDLYVKIWINDPKVKLIKIIKEFASAEHDKSSVVINFNPDTVYVSMPYGDKISIKTDISSTFNFISLENVIVLGKTVESALKAISFRSRIRIIESTCFNLEATKESNIDMTKQIIKSFLDSDVDYVIYHDPRGYHCLKRENENLFYAQMDSKENMEKLVLNQFQGKKFEHSKDEIYFLLDLYCLKKKIYFLRDEIPDKLAEAENNLKNGNCSIFSSSSRNTFSFYDLDSQGKPRRFSADNILKFFDILDKSSFFEI